MNLSLLLMSLNGLNGDWASREYAAKIAYQAGQITKGCKQLYSKLIPEFLNKTINEQT